MILTSLLAGCATGFHKYSFFSGGYKSQMLSTNEVKITFIGNGFSDPQKTYEYTMKAAGELTQQHGYRYFEILNQRTYLVPHTSYIGPVGIPETVNMPKTDMTIKMLNQKTTKAYDAKKVFGEVAKK